MNVGFRAKFEQRFVVTPGCWLWVAGRDSHGYGKISFRGKAMRAHRASYELYVGPIPSGMHILHRCDNPRCVNPEHLWPGTHAENMADKTSKGRAIGGAPGEGCYKAKLTRAQARSILHDHRLHAVIAQEYGVARSTVGDIKTGRSWVGLL